MRYSTLIIEAYPYLRALEAQVEGYENRTGTPDRRRLRTRRVPDSLQRLARWEARSAPSSRACGRGGV
jgi:hypothetical protein